MSKSRWRAPIGAKAWDNPSSKRLLRLAELSTFRTDRQGDAQISTDGHKLWIKTQRGSHVLNGRKSRALTSGFHGGDFSRRANSIMQAQHSE
jgi:hypothetical protein